MERERALDVARERSDAAASKATKAPSRHPSIVKYEPALLA